MERQEPRADKEQEEEPMKHLFVLVWIFQTGFLCPPDSSGTSSVDQAGFKLKDLPASAS